MAVGRTIPLIQNLESSQLITRYPQLEPATASVIEAVNVLIGAFSAGGRLLLCGNGGSAADSDHIAGELNKGFLGQRPLSDQDRSRFSAEDQHIADKLQGALPSINLTAASALLSAYGNDVDWTYALAQQVWAYGTSSDVLLALSTSGNSENVVLAAKTAKAKGVTTIGLTGGRESRLSAIADVTIMAPASDVHHIQELHLPIYHAICIELERHFFPG